MTPTNEFQGAVIALIGKAREINNQIGTYQQHFLNLNFNFSVKLSNGGIQINKEVARDYEKGAQFVSEEQIQRIASSFVIR